MCSVCCVLYAVYCALCDVYCVLCADSSPQSGVVTGGAASNAAKWTRAKLDALKRKRDEHVAQVQLPLQHIVERECLLVFVLCAAYLSLLGEEEARR